MGDGDNARMIKARGLPWDWLGWDRRKGKPEGQSNTEKRGEQNSGGARISKNENMKRKRDRGSESLLKRSRVVSLRLGFHPEHQGQQTERRPQIWPASPDLGTLVPPSNDSTRDMVCGGTQESVWDGRMPKTGGGRILKKMKTKTVGGVLSNWLST